MRKQIELYTDGACSGNPGPGGWGAILRYQGRERELSGGEPHTTNNRMELTAALRGLAALREPCIVMLHSDSKYLCDAINQRWLPSWKARGWRKADKSPVLNAELWQELDQLLMIHKVDFIWVKGHADNPLNNRCDELAVAQAKKFKEGL
ncbi:MAG: ribonuclease HI [Clostridia bacterium]|nr:ribonuclease HI [Clostridia bacterium]